MIEYQLIRSFKKNLSLQVKNNLLIVRAPMFVPTKQIEKFILQKQKWIKSKIHNIDFDINKEVFFLGKKYSVIKQECTIYIKNNNIIGRINLENLLEFYKSEFIKILTKYLPAIAMANNFSYNKVRIKKLRSIWGSCSYNNNLNFNYLLVQAPQYVIKDVIVHELCHTIHKNHSKLFWDLVYKISPEYDQTKVWFKKHAKEMMAINHL